MDYILSVEGYEINHIASNLTWSSNTDTLGQALTFEMSSDENNTFLPKAFIKVGNKVTLHHKSKIIFFGVVESEEANGRAPRKYNCFDLAFYLNKSTLTIQFNNKPADDCIKEICKKFGIKTTVTSIPTKIKKIYKSETVSEILKDILSIAEKQIGKKYRFEMRGDTLTVFAWKDIYVEGDIEWISNPQRSLSISSMKNSIEVVSGDEKKIKVIASVKDNEAIKKYGLLHHSESIDDKEKSKAKQVANNLLKELNKIQQSGSVSLLGNYEARAGRLIKLNEPITGLQGDYYIKDANHAISNSIHLMTLGLEVV
ncbi:XkdQ/YqbQ family protein [Lysinibacillus sphaericus]|uniref:YqbQ/XkdQ domain-containing protein n=1 Tax=Lysinibacillus sphaericus OT4b.31 TaxID=1285586 RepID=R7Z8L6_LYSSH|nr:hypothetical protein [Lysinibacillus sphaericus]EON70453.1 hypothetical protein H131_21252 [Lysinibacillus sphaericus OT4b.31]